MIGVRRSVQILDTLGRAVFVVEPAHVQVERAPFVYRFEILDPVSFQVALELLPATFILINVEDVVDHT